MFRKEFERRDFIKSLLGTIPVLILDWSSFPVGNRKCGDKNEWDAVIIGSGLGGLSCAAAFARQGFKPLVIEQHTKPGGYATTFKRQGFTFDVSLHSTSVGERNGVYNLIPGFPEIKGLEFVPHDPLCRVIFPEHDIHVPFKNVPEYIEILAGHFPEEKEGIKGLIEDMRGLLNDVSKLSAAGGNVDMSRFPVDFPYLFRNFRRTWGQMMDDRIKSPKLKAVCSTLWGYYGLPPSKLSAFYYAMPTIGYLQEGGFYAVGGSQKISNAMMNYIEERGGKVLLRTKVEEILLKEHAAYGVKTDDGKEYTGKAVVSNANAVDTFKTMMKEDEFLKTYLARFDTFSVSISCFQVFLGLKKALVSELGITDSEVFFETGYDPEAAYNAALKANVEDMGYGIMFYDNLYKGYSPEGKNTISIIALQGYEPWEKYEKDYFAGNKTEYRKEKNRITDIIIDMLEQNLLPGLRDAIEVKEAATPLTNLRYTGNIKGAIYGWDQTLNNSGNTRLQNITPIKNLYLSGAWTFPGHGYGGVISSGLQCFGAVMNNWKK